MLDSFLMLIARLCCQRPWQILSVSVLLATASAIYAAMYLQLNADADALIAIEQPFMEDYREFLDEFGDLEFLYIVLAGSEPSQREAAVDHLAAKLQTIELVPHVNSVITPHEQLRLATRSMAETELEELVLAAPALPELYGSTSAIIAAADDALAQMMRSNDDDIQSQLAAQALLLLEVLSDDELIELPERRYLVSDSGELHFIQLQPIKDYQTLAVIREPLRLIRQAMDETRQVFPDVEMGLTGKPVLQADEMETSDRDMTRAAVIAIILVTILFMIVIGGIWHPALAVMALLCGISWTFGLTTIVIGQLNLLSIVFTLVLVGVGIDFGIHIVSRYKEHRSKNNTIEGAIARTLVTAGHGNVTGAVTSSMAFFMAMFTQFHGLRELGFIAGSGLILCLVAMLLVLPCLIVVCDRWRERRGTSAPTLPARTPIQRGVWTFLMHKPRGFLIGVVLITLLLVPALQWLRYEQNLLELQADGLESVQWERRILADSAETWFGAVIVEDQRDILAVNERASQQSAIARTGSVFDVIAPPTDTREPLRASLMRTNILDLHRSDTDDWTADELDSVLQRLDVMAVGAAQRGLPDAERLSSLAQRLRLLQEQRGDETTAIQALQIVEHRVATAREAFESIVHGNALSLREALPEAIRDQFVSKYDRYLVTLHPVENVWEFEHMGNFVQAMRAVDPDATGVPITQYESLIEMRRAFITAALLAFAAVFVLIWLDMRRLSDTLLTIVPLLLGMVWLTQWMAISGVSFNPANFFAIPILIGIGVDSGIHLMHRYREQRSFGQPTSTHTFGSTRRAVLMTAMTSMIGFGCLSTASHRGLQSLGIVMALGAGAILITSLFVLPVLLAWLDRFRSKV